MELINLKDLNLTIEESRDIVQFIAQKRGISTKKLLSTIKPNLKRKNNEILTIKTQQKVAKTQQKSLKLKKRKNTQNLTYKKPWKLAKRTNLTLQKPLKTTKQQMLSKTKKE